jgi:succinate-semialdehyde dehydrogenase / glutarate-semialdehyde dehydrogenase
MAYISTNPFSERQVAAFPEHTDAELDTILSLAEQTFRRDWRDRGFDGRKAILKKAASILRDRRDHFATLATTEMGKLFRDTGQACTGSKRFIVVESMADSFIARFRDALDRLMPGDPMNEKTTLGPLYSRQALETVLKQIESAVAGGAEVLLGGKRLDRSGYFLVPTLLSHVEPGNPVFHQEFFAPVAVVFRVKDEQAAIALANDSPYGLGGTVISRDVARAKRVASQIEAGMVFINSVPQSTPELPFGGVKNSGFGRELSDLGIAEFVNKKLVRIA